jgi:shikimate O-hydroxycinnamoyltransferase
MKMEVHIVSREVIKPSSPTVQHKKPYKLSLFDQLTPTTYSTVIFFYQMYGVNADDITRTRIDHCKKSLSETLNIFYPLSGRVRGNLFIDSFNEGVPYIEAQVNCRLSDFLKHNEIESLNRLLPCQPYIKEDMEAPLVALQMNVFTCGGMAVAGAASHKIVDGATSKALFSTWASISRGDCNNIKQPDLEQASLFFPPRNSIPQNHLSLMETLWFTGGNYITRRFVFSAKAIATLRAMATAGKPDAKTSRIQALTCFIWKSFMAASRAISGSPKPSILVEAVDLRSRTKPPMSYDSPGNAFWWATALVNPMGTKTELPELAEILNGVTALFDSDYTETLQGEDGFETMTEYCNQLEELFSLEKPDIFAFTCWSYFGFTQTNFGWGEPIWVGLMGKVGPAFRNLTVLIETRDRKGIEAWVTLDEERMTLLERDPEFLAFASPDPKISSL